MHSQDFQDFHCSCFETSFGATRAGLSVEALLRLRGDERVEAERLVLLAVETGTDSRPILAAGHLKLQSAGPILKQRLTGPIDNARPDNRVHAAWALFKIDNCLEAGHIIVDVLKQTPRHQQWARMMAVESLADFGEVSLAVTPLFETLLDDDGFIAYLATISLKRIFGSKSAVVNLLNEIQLMQTGNKVSANRAGIQDALEQVKVLTGTHSSS